MSRATFDPGLYLVNAEQSACIRRFTALRNRVFAFHHVTGADLAVYAARGWRRLGFASLRESCEFLMGMLDNVTGAYNLWEAARDLSSACLAAENAR